LWKQDGVWLLGRRPEGAAKEWKNQVDKGLSGWAPSLWPRRLDPLVRQLVPGTSTVRVFRNADRAESFLGGAEAARDHLWRPWDDTQVSDGWGVLRLVLPTGPGQAVALAFSSRWTEPIPPHDVTSPAEAAGLVQAAAQVIRFTTNPSAQASRLAMASAFDRYLGTPGLFRRQGIWFSSAVADDLYPQFFRAHLEAGFLLNPDPQAPGILPGALSDGEWVSWKTVVDSWKEAHR
jgi:hypothetical protein